MRIKGTDHKAVEAIVAQSPVLTDYVRLYPDAQRRAVEIITSVAGDYASMGIDLLLEVGEDAAAKAERLRQAHGLTAAEAQLALHIAGGGSVRSHAAARGLSRTTVRNQLQSVFDKTGVHRQPELVRMLADFV